MVPLVVYSYTKVLCSTSEWKSYAAVHVEKKMCPSAITNPCSSHPSPAIDVYHERMSLTERTKREEALMVVAFYSHASKSDTSSDIYLEVCRCNREQF